MKVDNYEIKEVLRSEIILADYNPRKISEKARQKLKKNLKQYGLVNPPVVNKQTGGVLVSGHQRLSILDELNKFPGKDYKIKIAEIDVDPTEERKLNILLNNDSVMGEWDKNLLTELKLDFPEIDFEKDLGFDKMDLDYMFANDPNAQSIFSPAAEQKEVIADLAEIEQSKQAASDKMRELKKQYREEGQAKNKEGVSDYAENDDYLVTFVFNTNSEKYAFLNKIQVNHKEKFIKATKLFDILKDKYKF